MNLLLDGGATKRCVIYARVSTSDQETENQIAQLTEFASRQQGWEIKDTIRDVSSGGKSVGERQGLRQVFDSAHRKQFDVLLFWSLDRLSREGTRATINYLTRLEEYGVDWHSYTEQYLSSLGAFKDVVISLLATLGAQEKVRISERTRAGLARTRSQGTRLGRPATDPSRIRQATELRAKELSFSEIGRQMGVSKSRAQQLVAAGLHQPVEGSQQ
jgi:putative DNA-invertase from lambdoid prophage Rac